MAAPEIDPLPDPPLRSQDSTTFSGKAEDWVKALPDFGAQMQAVGEFAEAKAGEAQDWAEGDEPGGPGTLSAKGQAARAENAASSVVDIVAEFQYTKTLHFGTAATPGTSQNTGPIARGFNETFGDLGLTGADGVLDPFNVHMVMAGTGSFRVLLMERVSGQWRAVKTVQKTISATGPVVIDPVADWGLPEGKVLANHSIAVTTQSTGAQVDLGDGEGWRVSTYITDTALRTMAASTISPRISAIVHYQSLTERVAQVDESAAALETQVAELAAEVLMNTDVLIGPEFQAIGSATAGRTIVSPPATEPTIVDTIGYNSFTAQTSSGSGALKLLKDHGGGLYDVLASTVIQIFEGMIEIAPGVGWFQEGFILQPGQAVGVYGNGGRLRTSKPAPGNTGYVYTGDMTGYGVQATAMVDLAPQVHVKGRTAPGIRSILDGYDDRITAVETQSDETLTAVTAALAKLDPLPPEAVRGSVTLVDQIMAAGNALPASWVLSGWVQTANGIQSPTAPGDWSATAYYNANSSQDRKTVRMRVRIDAAGSEFALCTVSGDRGRTLMASAVTNTLTLYSNTDTLATPGAAGPSIPIDPAFFVVGREYVMEMKRIALTLRASITDVLTQKKYEIYYQYEASGTFIPLINGGVGCMLTAGQVTVSRLTWVVNVAQQFDQLWVGDSLTDGVAMALPDAPTAGRLVDKARGRGDVLVCGKSGDTMSQIRARMNYELTWGSPKYVILLGGTNDSSTSSWAANLAGAAAEVIAKGAIPVFVTPPPRPSSSEIAVRAARVRAKEFGPNVIDLNLAVSLNHDGVNWDDTLQVGDGTHLNVLGNQKYLAQARIDCPFLFDHRTGL